MVQCYQCEQMPWFFTIPEFLKKRACRYLLQHYLGQFLEERINLDDLTVDLYNGTGSIHNVPLNVEAINEVLLESGAPIKVLSGYLGCVTVRVPWSALLKDNCRVEISELTLCVAPDFRFSEEDEASSMTDSLFSMTTSMQLAEEVLKSGPSPGESEDSGAFEGMEALARAIELVLARVQIKLVNATVQINYRTADQTRELFLKARVNSIEFYDELSKTESSVDNEGESPAHPLPDISVKMLQLSGITLEVGSNTLDNVHLEQSIDDPIDSSVQLTGVPIATAGGQLSVKVQIKVNESRVGPKLQVDGFLSSLHILLSPGQLAMLQEMAAGLTTHGGRTTSKKFEKMSPNLNRPIPKGDMKTIESQLARHQLKEQRAMTRIQQRKDPFHADPWTNALGTQPQSLIESTHSSVGEFHSLDLNTSFAESTATSITQSVSLEDSFDSRLSSIPPRRDILTKCESADIPLHSGVGLQQLPGASRSNSKHHQADSGSSSSGSPRMSHNHQDNVCHYSLTLGGVTLALLESQPIYTYTTSGISSSQERLEEESSYCPSIDEGGLDPGKYFEAVCRLLSDGISRRQLASKGEELAEVLPSDHLLLWLSTLKSSVMTSGSAVDVELSVASGELWEYLYRNTAQLNTITTPLSISPIVQLSEDTSVAPPLPCLKLHLSSSNPTLNHKKRSHDHGSNHVTSMEVQLATVNLNADVSLLDRLQPIISALSHTTQTSLRTSSLEKVKQSLYMTASNFQTINLQRQAVFNQAMASEQSDRDHILSIRTRAATLNLSLRFPIPELVSTQHPPWHLPSLRPEVLFVSVGGVALSSQLHPPALKGEGLASIDLKFDSAKAYLSCDGSIEERQLFLTVLPTSHQASLGIKECGHVRLVVQPSSTSALETESRKDGVDVLGRYESSEGELGSKVNQPSPFSSQKTMVSTNKTSDQDAGKVHCEEQVLPGSRREMDDFLQHASDSAHYAVTCTLPQVKVHLPSNKFLEILYNRFATDLALWEPASPAAVEKANAHSMMINCMDILQPAATIQDHFEMCKSVLKEEDSDDESTLETATPLDRTFQPHPPGLNSLSVSVTIKEGVVSMVTQGGKSDVPGQPIPEESVDSTVFHSAQSVAQLLDLSSKQNNTTSPTTDSGLAVLRASGVRFFIVLGFKGNPTHNYVSMQVTKFSMHHAGSLNGETYSCVEDPLGTHSVLGTLLPVLYCSHGNKAASQTGYGQPEPMLAVAIEMKIDKERNSKTNKVSVALRDMTMQYHMTSPELNAFKQLADFFTLVDDEVMGYEPPSVITELHTHLHDCSLEYKPLYLSLHLLLCLDSASLSTSLVTGAPVLVLRLLTDSTYLLLAHKHQQSSNSKQGFVCVLEMEWFDLTLRLCNNEQLEEEDQKLFSQMPDISVECSSNVVHLRTCADSCIALRDLLVYLATNGDLQTPNKAPTDPLRDYSKIGQELVSLNSQHSSGERDSPLTSLTDTTDIGDLISDAMEDLVPSASPSHKDKRSDRRHKMEKNSKPQMDFHVENDKSVVLDFHSDSSDDEALGVMNKARGVGDGVWSGVHDSVGRTSQERLLLSPPRKAGKMSSSERSSIFSESDDDFCFVDTPTTTRVSPGNKPQMKCLLDPEERIELVENHFALPDGHTDQLQRPKHFPEPVSQFTLKEITIVWHLYGGTDFSPPPSDSTPPYLQGDRARSGSGGNRDSLKKTSAKLYSSSPGADYVKVPSLGGGKEWDWRSAGGPGRRHDILVEVELDKLRVQHEKYPANSEQVARLVLLVHELEVRDRLRQSNINKLLYQYTTEASPRQSHAHMLSLKVLFTRPELTSDPSIEEASVRVSVLPIRLNIDQDTVLFLCDYIKQVGSTSTVQAVGLSLDANERGGSDERSTNSTNLSPSNTNEVFIKSFIFQPDLPIRIDYEAKGFKTEMGTLAGIMLGLSHLNTSEVRLKALTYKKGVLGWSRLVDYTTNEWAQDIKAYQLPLILKGVGPMHQVTQLVYGLVDLFWLPYQQYQEDGRVMWGLQRGATAFTASTGVALVELSSRLLESVQSFAQMAYDMVAPTECPSNVLVHQHKPHEPLDFREGFANAYDVVSAGIGGTARDMYVAATREHEERGVTGAVGGVLRQIPSTIVKPIILASEATRHVLGGVKNQFVPDARKEASKKWKASETTEQH